MGRGDEKFLKITLPTDKIYMGQKVTTDSTLFLYLAPWRKDSGCPHTKRCESAPDFTAGNEDHFSCNTTMAPILLPTLYA